MKCIPDGKVWCEACHCWFDKVADYQRHKPSCPERSQQVEFRHSAGSTQPVKRPA